MTVDKLHLAVVVDVVVAVSLPPRLAGRLDDDDKDLLLFLGSFCVICIGRRGGDDGGE